eukprot:04043_4
MECPLVPPKLTILPAKDAPFCFVIAPGILFGYKKFGLPLMFVLHHQNGLICLYALENRVSVKTTAYVPSKRSFHVRICRFIPCRTHVINPSICKLNPEIISSINKLVFAQRAHSVINSPIWECSADVGCTDAVKFRIVSHERIELSFFCPLVQSVLPT